MLGRLLVVALTFFPLVARACDLCGGYTPQLESMPKEKGSLAGFYAAVAEQFTLFGSLQFDDREVANPTGQRLDSSITQFVVGYEINDRFALQFNAPLIYRDFRRPEGFAIDEGSVSGLGDVSLLAKAVLWRFASPSLREFNVEGKNPVAIEHESDCTCSIVADTGVTSVLNWSAHYCFARSISGELVAEFPVLMNTTAFQAVPDRLHASVAVSW